MNPVYSSAGYPAQAYPAQAYSTQGYPQAYGQPAYAYPSAPVQVPMGPSMPYGYPYPYSLGARLRRFFGFAPSNGVRYKTDRDTWGFMGYSRRQRYIDPRTGGEVDRQGRPVYRV